MKELQFDTGLVTYKVNGSCEITFNPGDIGFVKKLFDLFDRLSGRQETAEKKSNEEISAQDLFELTGQWDAEMRADIDGLFGEGVSKALFPEVSVFALGGGFPLWANFCMAVIDEIDGNLAQEEQKARTRVDKYMKKYKSYKKK